MIRAKASQLFAKEGFKAVTMQAICQATGLSRGGLYRHYNSTYEIFCDILAELLSVQQDNFTEKINNNVPAVVILDEVLKKYQEEMLDEGASLSVALYEFYSLYNEETAILDAQYQQSKDMWFTLMQYGITRGEFNKVDLESVYAVILFGYQGVRMYSRLIPMDAGLCEKMVRRWREMLVKEKEVM